VKEKAMMLNEGYVDRAVRVVLGLALLAMVFVGPHTWLGWLGVIPLVTGLVGFCPLYRVFGLRTTKAT
jgi:membrane protein implicated in regulation of membrane protease activity